MKWEGKTVLITGAGGFIGSHLVEKLIDFKANVKAFVHYNNEGRAGFIDTFSEEKKKNVTIVYGDIMELATIERAMENVDVVFHLAASISVAYSFENPEEVISANAKGTLNILTAAKNKKIERIITTSSSEVYGSALFKPITEEHPLQGQSPYAASKIAGDKYVESFYKSYKLPVTIVRPFNTFGPRQSARAVIPTIIMQTLTKDKIKLGALSPRRDFVFVKDTVKGFIKVAEAGEETHGEVFNLATGESHSIEETANLILNILNKKLNIESDEQRLRPEKAEVNELLGDAKKVLEATGWKPDHTFEQGLQETIEWIKENINIYNPDKYYK